MLALLTDEHITHDVADQVRAKDATIRIESVLTWRGGNLRNKPDEHLLAEALSEAMTLVTYDQTTISPLLVVLATCGVNHAGVIFIDRKSVRAHDVGGLVRALTAFHANFSTLDWTNLVMYLPPVV